MIKATCPQKGCGANFNFGDGTTKEQVDAAVASHVEREHGTVESKHREYLENSRDAFGLIAGRGKITSLEAKELHNAASDLLRKPRLAVTEIPEPETVQEEKKNDDHSDVSQALPDPESVVPVREDSGSIDPGDPASGR